MNNNYKFHKNPAQKDRRAFVLITDELNKKENKCMSARWNGIKTGSRQNWFLIRVLTASFVLLTTSFGVNTTAHAYGAVAQGSIEANPGSADLYFPGNIITTEDGPWPTHPFGIVGDEVSEPLTKEEATKEAIEECESHRSYYFRWWHFPDNTQTDCELVQTFKGCASSAYGEFGFVLFIGYGVTEEECFAGQHIHKHNDRVFPRIRWKVVSKS